MGITSYINALPFQQLLDPQFEFILDVPTKLNKQLRENNLDVSLISSIEFLKGDYEWVAPFGIASRGKILSVNVYLEESVLKEDEIVCAVTEESATSVKLFEVIVTQFWKKKIKLVPLQREQKNRCFLLIGNEALENQHFPGFITIDLASEWKKFTGLEFVFALFAKRKGVDDKKLQSQLENSLLWSMSHSDKIIDCARLKSKKEPSFLQSYFACHKYMLDENDFKGLNKFAAYVR